MVQSSNLSGFATDWNKRVAWAQSQGISKNSYYPIYQMDSARLLSGEQPMSNAEATRAILAASNPRNVTPVPGDKPNPTNVLGNTVNDLRSIFTGLSPNHLVSNIFDTVKTAVVHPSSVIKPLADIAQGNVKQGLEAAAGLNGQNSILSWLPGVYVAGEIAQGGVSEALSHPVVSFLDVAPFAPAGRVIEAGADASRVASMADRLGVPSSQIRDMTLPGMAKSWVLNTKLTDLPMAGRLVPGSTQVHELTTVGADGAVKETTVGDTLERWINAHTGMGKTLSSLMKGMLNINHTETTYEQAVIAPATNAMAALKPDQQAEVDALVRKSDPRAQGKSDAQIALDDSIPENVRKAFSAEVRLQQWVKDQGLADGHVVAFPYLDGTIGYSHTAGNETTVLDASREAHGSLEALLKKMDPANKITESIRQWDRLASGVQKTLGQDRVQAAKRAQFLDGTHRMVVGERKTFRDRVQPETVPINIGKQARWLFGSVDAVTGEGGIFDSIDSAMNSRDYAQVKELSGAALRALSGHGVHAIDATIDPIFVKVRQDAVALHRYAIKRLDAEAKFQERMQGYTAHAGGPGLEGIQKEWGRYLKATRDFANATWQHPTGEWMDVVQQNYIQGLVTEMRKFGTMEDMSKVLRDRGFAAEEIDRLQKDPVKMAQLFRMEVKRLGGNPTGVTIMTKDDMDEMYQSAVDGAEKARTEGFEVVWSPHIANMDQVGEKLRKMGMSESQVARLVDNPALMAELDLRMNHFGADRITKKDLERLWREALKKTDKMRKSGYETRWIPSVSTTMLRGRDVDTGLLGIHVSGTGRVKTPRLAHKKTGNIDTPTRYDVLASLHLAAKEALQREGTIEFADRYLSPHLKTRTEVENMLDKMPEFRSEILAYKTSERTGTDVYADIVKNHFKMQAFDPESVFGWTLPKWDQEMYIPKSIADSLDKMLDKGQFPLQGFYSGVTKLFRTSILNYSPRYTAHVGLGGTFLLALHASPYVIHAIPKAWNDMRNTGDVPRESFQGAAQRSMDPVEYRKTVSGTILGTSGRAFHEHMGAESTRWPVEENIEKKQGVKLAAATGYHYLKAIGDLNIKVTTYMAQFQRAVAYEDYLQKGLRTGKFTDPATGKVTEMTMDRARKEAEENMLHVMGDNRAMTPLERSWLNQIFPFYGWTKHILHFVMSYPSDHPFRTQMLAVLAEQNSNDVPAGLPTRIQLLMFLGSPDVEGNVTAIDVRSMDPLRDVANYATLAGVISSLNPVLSAPLAVIDPNIIFGGNPLYPNVTYDQFYGIEAAGSQGSPLTALEQVVPQVTALDAALNLSGQFRNEAATNPNAFAKTIFSALNIPFAQVQHLNLKQIAAKDELDRYHVTSQAASNAFQSGDFSTIAPLSSVPDPLNADYDVSPKNLSELYNQLLQQYPGQPPSETALPPPPAPI